MTAAHNKYIPVSSLPETESFVFDVPNGSAKRFDNELFLVTAKLKREQMAELEDRYLREPENVFVKNRYAMLLARTGDAQKAESILKEALGLTPQNAVVLNNLGNVAFINGNYDNALLNYEAAAALDSADSEILINICHTLLAMNRTVDARSIFEKAAQIDAGIVELYPHLKSKVQ
jgi:tetratricopeptide (TPR) repeat protein